MKHDTPCGFGRFSAAGSGCLSDEVDPVDDPDFFQVIPPYVVNLG